MVLQEMQISAILWVKKVKSRQFV